MRRLIAWTLTLAVGAWASETASAQGNPAATKRPTTPAASKPAQQPQPQPTRVDPNATKARLDADLKAREDMNRLLEAWEKQSKKLVSLYVVFTRIDRSPAWGDQFYQGQAMLQSPNLACLEFQKYKVGANGKPLVAAGKDGKPALQLEPKPYERIVCTGNEVLQYTWDDEKIFVFPLDKQIRQKALQQGPLPFLFNMKAADAKQRYSMTLMEQDDKEYKIGIIPMEEIDKESFRKAILWLNKETFLPDYLCLYPDEQKPQNYQEFRFIGSNNIIKPNTAMDKNFFTFSKIDNWKVIVNPGAGGGAPGANQGQAVAPPGRRAVPQPAMAPAGRPR